MPRTYQRKTQRQHWDPERMQSAIDEVKNGMAIKSAAKTFDVPVMSLKRRVRNKNLIAKDNIKHLGSKITVFTQEQENELIQHILDLETRMYGITTRDLRHLAYQLAERNHLAHNFSRTKMSAGKDWLLGFQRRHPGISLRRPESTSAARARAFNRPAVTKFYNLLKNLLQKYKYPSHRIYNVDETSISTVPGRNSKIFAKRGRKQVARVTSAERGISSTAVICTSAAGSFVPPMIIFSRKRMKAELMDGAPPGTLFACNEHGWMKLDLFKHWFDHFLRFTKPSQDDPILLILDGHLSHTKNLEVILKARENFVSMLCLPPHTTHKLQPLDVGVMFPLSTYLDQALERWMNNHPGRTVTVFQISQLFCEAYLKASTPINSINGFCKTGIIPFNPEIFTDADFVAAEVTDEPYQTNEDTPGSLERSVQKSPIPGPSSRHDTVSDIDVNISSCSVGAIDCHLPDEPYQAREDAVKNSETRIENSVQTSPIPGPSSHLDSLSNFDVNSSSFSIAPIDCHPLPKIAQSRRTQKRRSTGTVILTSTPYKDSLEEEKRKKIKAEDKKKKRKDIRVTKGRKKPVKAKKTKKRNQVENNDEESSYTDDDVDIQCLICCESYKFSSSGEGWIRCNVCLKWAHDACAGVSDDEDEYSCDFCTTNQNVSSIKRNLKF